MHGNNYHFVISVLHELFSINKLHKLLLNVIRPCDDLSVWALNSNNLSVEKTMKIAEEIILLQQNFNH